MIAFANSNVGVVSIAGFVGSSSVVSSWQERTTDGGRHWTVGPVQHTGDGRYPTPVASTQVGSVFTSSRDGWAYAPSLFFTTDGGVSWHAETPLPLSVGAVAVAGSSTWVAVNRCRYNCPSRLYQASHVGGPLTLLPSQPTQDELIVDLHRPSTTTAWAVIEDSHGRQQLTTTTDAGRSWRARRVPCTAADTFQVSGNRPARLLITCASPSQGMGGGDGGPRVLYRSSDNGIHWVRVTPTPSPISGPTAPGALLFPVGSSTVWSTNQPGVGGGRVVRSTDGGRSWHQVLTSAPGRELAVESFAADGTRHAWLVSMTSSDEHGIGFTVYRTTNGGRTWTSSNLPIPESLLTG